MYFDMRKPYFLSFTPFFLYTLHRIYFMIWIFPICLSIFYFLRVGITAKQRNKSMQRRFKAKAPAVFNFIDLLSFNSESDIETTLDIL